MPALLAASTAGYIYILTYEQTYSLDEHTRHIQRARMCTTHYATMNLDIMMIPMMTSTCNVRVTQVQMERRIGIGYIYLIKEYHQEHQTNTKPRGYATSRQRRADDGNFRTHRIRNILEYTQNVTQYQKHGKHKLIDSKRTSSILSVLKGIHAFLHFWAQQRSTRVPRSR